MDITLQRDLAGRDTMQRILDAAGMTGCEHVIDYGGGRGVWSQSFPRSTVYDPWPEEWGEPTERQRFTDDLESIDQADGILLVGTQQLLSHQETLAFLDFARQHIEPGGRVLVSLPSVRMVTEWLVRGVQPRNPLWLAQPVLAMRPGWTGAYCTRLRAFTRHAERYGFHVTVLPRSVDDDYKDMIGTVSTGRWYHWLVLER